MNTAAFPRYRCHKVVRAVKIERIEHAGYPGAARLLAADPGIAPFNVDVDFIRKHAPEPGGYLVVYEDGYVSYSPKQAFEAGYARIG